MHVYDTQTGLRAFSVKRISEMSELSGDRYEYEINQLIYCTQHNIEIVVDRLAIKEGIEKRLSDSIETVLKLTDGLLLLDVIGEDLFLIHSI